MPNKTIQPKEWVTYTAIGLVVSITLAFCYIAFAPYIGLSQRSLLHYIILVVLASSASILFAKTLRSYARFEGKQLNGTISLGGPVVIFGLVVIGGFISKQRFDSTAKYNLVVNFASAEDASEEISGYAIVKYGAIPQKYAIEAGKIIVPNVIADVSDSIEIIPKVSGYDPLHKGAYPIPSEKTGLLVKLVPDKVRMEQINYIKYQLLGTLHLYLLAAKDLSKHLTEGNMNLLLDADSDTGLVVSSLHNYVNRYNAAYDTLTSKLSFLSRHLKEESLISDQSNKALKEAIEQFHKEAVLEFDDGTNDKINKYINQQQKDGNLKEQILEKVQEFQTDARRALVDLDKAILEIEIQVDKNL